MGADGDTTADAWYRTAIDIDSAGMYTLRTSGGGDRATLFVDGTIAGAGLINDNGEIPFTLSKGKHVLAVFTAHDGRSKFYGVTGVMDSIDNKGLFGQVLLHSGKPSLHVLTGWRFLKAGKKEDVTQGIPSPEATGWTGYACGKDAFNGKEGYGWFQTILPGTEPGISQVLLNFKSVDENAVIFVNGKLLGRHEGWNQPFSFVVDHMDTMVRPITLTLFIENYDGGGGIDQPVFCDKVQSYLPVTGWRMQDGMGDPAAQNGWTPLGNDKLAAVPCFFRTRFTAPAYNKGHHPIWRVTNKGLGHGSVWVNGHNLGRYPEKVPINGLYIPECWLNTGMNELVIYEEDGKSPADVTIEAEEAASRDDEVQGS